MFDISESNSELTVCKTNGKRTTQKNKVTKSYVYLET